jgi:hypothetical protein
MSDDEIADDPEQRDIGSQDIDDGSGNDAFE